MAGRSSGDVCPHLPEQEAEAEKTAGQAAGACTWNTGSRLPAAAFQLERLRRWDRSQAVARAWRRAAPRPVRHLQQLAAVLWPLDGAVTYPPHGPSQSHLAAVPQNLSSKSGHRQCQRRLMPCCRDCAPAHDTTSGGAAQRSAAASTGSLPAHCAMRRQSQAAADRRANSSAATAVAAGAVRRTAAAGVCGRSGVGAAAHGHRRL